MTQREDIWSFADYELKWVTPLVDKTFLAKVIEERFECPSH